MAAISTVIAGVGLGLSAAGTFGSFSASKDANAAQQAMIAAQQEQERLRKRAMMLDAKRKSMEMLRAQQRARALALTNATAQGANAGSGLQGGYGQIGGQTGFNLSGLESNVLFGKQMFGINETISGLQGQYADARSSQATWQGIGSLGTQLMGSASTIGNIFGGGASAAGGSAPMTWAGGNANPYMRANAGGWV